MLQTDDASPAVAERPLLGLLLVVVTVFFFALADVITKHLTAFHPVPVIVAVRYLVSLVLLVAVFAPRLGRRLWQTGRPRLVLLRGLVLSGASLLVGLAFSRLPVGETVAIMYLAPFVVMALAVPLFGERVSSFGWFLAVLGFSGVLVILRPGGGLDALGVVFALANACCHAAFHLITRALSRTETAIALLFHVTVVGAVVFTLMSLPFVGRVPLPSPGDLGLMALLGVFTTAAHAALAAAYREAPASLVAPANYLHLVWAALLGWLVFGHVPDGWTLGGMGLIVAAGLGLAFRARLERRPAALTATPPVQPSGSA
jgi:drug/metabolite transporter (DMT)-like permease